MTNRSTALKPVDEDVKKRHPSVPDVRGEREIPPDQPEYQPPKNHLGMNPANQYIPEPTPTAAADRSVPDAPVVGDAPREPLPPDTKEGSAQETAIEAGAAFAPGKGPQAREAREARESRRSSGGSGNGGRSGA